MDLKVLELLDKHSREVAVIVLAMLLAGSLAGGLYIKSLRDQISNFRTLSEERDSLQQERHDLDTLRMHAEINVTRDEVALLTTAFDSTRMLLWHLQGSLTALRPHEPVSPETYAAIEASITALGRCLGRCTTAVGTARALAASYADLFYNLPMETEASRIHYLRSSSLVLYVQSGLIILLLVMLFRKHRKARGPKHRHV